VHWLKKHFYLEVIQGTQLELRELTQWLFIQPLLFKVYTNRKYENFEFVSEATFYRMSIVIQSSVFFRDFSPARDRVGHFRFRPGVLYQIACAALYA